jgi:hypothetical protein
MTVPGKVVGVCCIPTTILTDFGASGPAPGAHSTAGKAGSIGWPVVSIESAFPGRKASRFPQQKSRSDGAAALKHDPV